MLETSIEITRKSSPPAFMMRCTALGVAALLAIGCGDSDDDTDNTDTLSNQEVVELVLQQGLVGGDVSVVEEYVLEDYIQHSTLAADGRAGLLQAIDALAGISVEIHRTLVEGDLVATHNTYTVPDGSQMVAFDVFRLEDGRLAEHWDALQTLVPASETVSGRSMVDGPTTIDNSADTAANKQLVSGFVEDILTNGNFDVVTDYVSTETYNQHNPLVADGLDGLNEFVASLAADGIGFGYTRTPLIVAQGDFVLTGSEGFFGPSDAAPFAVFYDLFRVENGKIVEHWDVIPNPAPDPDNLPHDNGLF
ncbi:MAG: nuclear transport factor 2 family protein [Myxococcota bacterium]